MTEKEALKQIELICEMMILCIEGNMPQKSEQYADKLHAAYSDWFSAWRNNEYNQHR